MVVGIAALVLLADQVTKAVIDSTLALGESWSADMPVRITHVRNTGSAFGLFPNQTLFLIIASFVAIIIMLVYYRRAVPTRRDKLVTLSFGLQLGGAIGNLANRIWQGFVIDFIDFRVWPVFNVADASITIGLILLIVFFLLSDRAQRLARIQATMQAEKQTAQQATFTPSPRLPQGQGPPPGSPTTQI